MPLAPQENKNLYKTWTRHTNLYIAKVQRLTLPTPEVALDLGFARGWLPRRSESIAAAVLLVDVVDAARVGRVIVPVSASIVAC